jgi:hypothetical protein
MKKQLVSMAFSGGIDTKTDEFHVAPPKLALMQNGVFNNTGALSKRWGYKALGKSNINTTGFNIPPAITSATAINSFGNELLLYDGRNVFSYTPSRDAWVNRSAVISVIQSNTQVIRGTNQQLSPDFATLNGIDVFAWEDSRGGGGIRYQVKDSSTGTILLADSPIIETGGPTTYIRPKCIAFPAAGVIVILFVNSAGGQLLAVTVSPLNPVRIATAATVLKSGISTTPSFDACIMGSNLAIVYYDVGAIKWFAVSSTFAVSLAGTTLNSPAGNPTGRLNIVSDASNRIWASFIDAGVGSTTCSTAAFDSAGNPLFSTTQIVSQGTGQIQSLAGIVSGNTLTLYVEAQGSTNWNNVVYSNTITSGGALGVPAASASPFLRGFGLASKPFSYNGVTYLNLAFQTPLQPTYFTVDQVGNVVSKVNAGLAGGLIENSDFMLPECQQVSTGVFRYANLIKGVANTESGVVLSLLGVNVTKLDFFDPNHFLSAAINGGLYTVGGVVQSYDGAHYVEHGFHVYPEQIGYTPHTSGGLMADGTYFYAVTYEWVDNNGLRQLSTPSVAHSVTISGGAGLGSVTVVVPTLRLTKKANVQIVIYRTTAGGTLLQRVTSAIAPTYNVFGVDTIAFTDTLNDTSIAANGLMYTQPLATAAGTNPVLPNSAPPACSLITTYANRVFLAGVDDPYTLWYTKVSTPGIPMEFSSALTLRVDPDGGGITAIARMDDKLVVFKQDAVFIIVGQGPTATGDQNDFVDFVQVPSGGIGCASQSSVVLTPLGLMFDSGNGIYLLDRGLNVSYKGAPAQAYTNPNSAAYLGPISSATVIPNQWVVFTTTSSVGTQIVYDYYYDQWGTFTGAGTIVDSTLFFGESNLFAYARSDGTVFLQTPSTFTDNGVPIVLDVVTSWITMDEIHGYQRLYHGFVLGHYKGSHSLNVWYGFNRNPNFTQLATIPVDQVLGVSTFGTSTPFGADALFGGGSDPDQSVYMIRTDVLTKCESFRLHIYDQESNPGNEGLSLAALGFVVGVKSRRGYPVPPGKQIGAA